MIEVLRTRKFHQQTSRKEASRSWGDAHRSDRTARPCGLRSAARSAASEGRWLSLESARGTGAALYLALKACCSSPRPRRSCSCISARRMLTPWTGGGAGSAGGGPGAGEGSATRRWRPPTFSASAPLAGAARAARGAPRSCARRVVLALWPVEVCEQWRCREIDRFIAQTRRIPFPTPKTR